MGPLSGPLGSHESLPVLWLDGVCNQIHRLSHRVEADESSGLMCCSLDRVVERKARALSGIKIEAPIQSARVPVVHRQHAVRPKSQKHFHRAPWLPPTQVTNRIND